MCSANGVLLIDLSSIKSLHFMSRAKRVWIGAGAKLQDVYVELWQRGYYFPGGACGDVHVGGLTLLTYALIAQLNSSSRYEDLKLKGK